MAHVRPSGRASRTAMRVITDIDISLTLQHAQSAGLNIDEGDVEEFYSQASCDRNLWVEVCTLLKAGNYAGLALKAANVTHVDEITTVELAGPAKVQTAHTITFIVVDDDDPYQSGESDSWDNCVMPECAKYAQNEVGIQTAKNDLKEWNWDRRRKSRNTSRHLSQSVR